jgi:hypothetical protein
MQRFAAVSEPYGKGQKAGVGALLDPELLGRLRRYKRQVAKRYRVVEPDLVERLLPDEQLFVSPKLDGELWFLVHLPEDGARAAATALVAYNGRVLTGVTTLDGLEAKLAKAPLLVIAGELVASTTTGERARSHHTGAALSESKLEPSLSFRAFDLVEEGADDALLRPYEARHGALRAYLGDERLVPTERGTPTLVAQRYREWVATGAGQKHEGLVVRSDRGLTYKIKPTITVDLVVVAYGERITGEARQVRELEVALVRDDGTLQLVGSVGGGMSEDDRSRWHAKLSALESKSSFRLANREGTLCRFVRPEIVVEVRVSDFLSTDAWDAPIRRMTLAYDAATGYRPLSEMRTAVLIHPALLRERTDKKADATDAGISQITAYLEDVAPEARAAAVTHRKSEVIRRAVYTKETKGQLAVRKYVVVKTNKEAEGTHPPYVVFFTDYSAGRKTPLETSLRTGASVEACERAIATWIEENVKKGWSEAGAAKPAAAAPTEGAAADAPADGEPKKAPAKRTKKPKNAPE